MTVTSNAFPSHELAVVKRKERDGARNEYTIPAMIASYNRYMGGVDHSDQLKNQYGYSRKMVDAARLQMLMFCIGSDAVTW